MCLAFAAHFAFFYVDRRPSTVNRHFFISFLLFLLFLPFLPFLALSALKQTSLALRAISPNLGENELPSPKLHLPYLRGGVPIILPL